MPIADTFCYCLMPNHFHFLLRVKPEAVLINYFRSRLERRPNPQGFKNLEGLRADLPRLLTLQFSNLQNSYAKAFNKMYKRKGSLFMHPYKRLEVNDTAYLRQLVHYIHLNPVEAGLVSAAGAWKFSSWHGLVSGNHSFICRNEVIDWFNDMENFIQFHTQEPIHAVQS